MLGRTHFVLGMASALIVIQPQTVPEVIGAMAGGAIGGWIADVDIKNRNVERSAETKREIVYDTIIESLFLLAFIVVDYFTGKGMCQYVIDNWGLSVWGGLLGLTTLSVVGLFTKHRTFTHSFLAMALFSGMMFLFCQPVMIPFLIGYASHLVSDFFNKQGIQLFFPLRWKPCLRMCLSDKKANRYLFWICLTIDILLGAYLFSKGMLNANPALGFIPFISSKRLLGLNIFQIYLIFVNMITFIGFERSYRFAVQHNDDYETPESRFSTWLLNIFAFLGGGVGMLLSFIIHIQIPSAYNGNWWAFCYTSILFWFTIYCYFCDPFGLELNEIIWLSTKHIPFYIYILIINSFTALVIYKIRNRRFKETDIKHTLILLLGALGGTAGAIPMVFLIKRKGKYYYVVMGFFIMMLSQIVFFMYMMAAGVF